MTAEGELVQFKLQQLHQLIDLQEQRLEGHEDDFVNPAPVAIRWMLEQLVELRDELETPEVGGAVW
jgi:hypothetical protein